MVDARACVDRGHHACRNRDGQRHEHGGERKFDGGGQPRRDGRGNAFVRPQRYAQVAARGALEKRGVLNVQGPVKPEPAPQFSDALGRCGIAQHRLDRVAGNEMEEGEDQRRDAKQNRNREQHPPSEKPQHDRS